MDLSSPSEKELHDLQKDGKERPWKEKKLKSLKVSAAYNRIGLSNKGFRMAMCGSNLDFRVYNDDKRKLHSANFCKQRLCPMCNWRRSKKVFAQMSQIMDEAQRNPDKEYAFLTLTVRNCLGEDLRSTLDKMLKAYDKLFKRREIVRWVDGAFRAIEITHNLDINSEWFDTYHPHIHCILMVDKSYFSVENELSWNKMRWVQLWQESFAADYAPSVDIRKTYGDSAGTVTKAVIEAAKYAVKDADYLIEDNLELQDKTIRVLDDALAGKRLLSFRGEFAKIRKRLKLDDIESGDLVETGEDSELREDLNYIIEHYRWSMGYSKYLRVEAPEQAQAEPVEIGEDIFFD